MSNETKVTIFRGGTQEKTLPISQIEIPDLWHIVQAIRSKKELNDPNACADMILKCWHIAGALKNHIEEN